MPGDIPGDIAMAAKVVMPFPRVVASQPGLTTEADLLLVFFEAAQSTFNQYEPVESWTQSGWQ